MKGMKYPPFAKPAPAVKAVQRPDVEDLPSIDSFLDELPSIDDFLEREPPPVVREAERTPALEAPPAQQPEEQQVEGWAPGDWQSYDWSALSRIATPAVPSRAITEAPASSASDEVAEALEGIARRIRSGELVIDNLQGTPPEAAMAAALAIVLRMRG